MKTYMTITTMLVLTLTLGLAYAGEATIKDVGTELYLSAFPINDASMRTAAVVKDERFSRPDDDVIPALTVKNDIGSILYADAFEKGDVVFADTGVKGSAAGGMAKEDENTRIWDHLLGTPGGSDLP